MSSNLNLKSLPQAAPSLKPLKVYFSKLLAYAVITLFPKTQLVGGGAGDYYFFYDFILPKEIIDNNALMMIEERMRVLQYQGLDIDQQEMLRANAIELFKHQKQYQIARFLSGFSDQLVSVIKIQNDFYDLYLDPMLLKAPSGVAIKILAPSIIPAEGLNSKENSPILRIQGAVAFDSKALKKQLKNCSEAQEFTHLNLGTQMKLFLDTDQGRIWLPKGEIFRQLLISYRSDRLLNNNFEFVTVPLYSDNFTQDFIDIYLNSSKGAYQELPLRYAALAPVDRDLVELEDQGLWRSNCYLADLQYIICAKEQLRNELISSLRFITETANIFGLDSCWQLMGLTTRNSGNVSPAGQLLIEALNVCGYSFEVVDAEADNNDPLVLTAGPSAILTYKDVYGKKWKGPYVKVESSARIAPLGSGEQLTLISRSLYGSIDRALAFLLEHSRGNLPVAWAPEQLRLLPLKEAHIAYANEVLQQAKKIGIRVTIDYRLCKLGTKILSAEVEKVPYIAVIGDSEVSECKVTLRGKDYGDSDSAMTLSALFDNIKIASALPGGVTSGA